MSERVFIADFHGRFDLAAVARRFNVPPEGLWGVRQGDRAGMWWTWGPNQGFSVFVGDRFIFIWPPDLMSRMGRGSLTG